LFLGTWTAPSWFVGPRTPFALDPNVDYSLDEGLDWEPENLDEGAMDVDEPDESESEDDDDLGSWLASDDEREESPAVAVNDPFAGGNLLGMPNIKPTNKEQKLPPRKFEKLIQFSKGPVWEEGLGEVAWKGFEQYRICLLNGKSARIHGNSRDCLPLLA
jgi:chromatin assembly factor 1 subunit A